MAKGRFLALGLLCISAFVLKAKADVLTWTCEGHAGFMGATHRLVKLEKTAKGYSLYLTDSSSDVGPAWHLNDERVGDQLDCKFSAAFKEPVYCSSTTKDGWLTIFAENLQIDAVDQSTGRDKRTKVTSIVVSGTSEVLNHYTGSVFKMGAESCSRN